MRALPATLQDLVDGIRPNDAIPRDVCNSHDRIVERRLIMRDAALDDPFLLLLAFLHTHAAHPPPIIMLMSLLRSACEPSRLPRVAPYESERWSASVAPGPGAPGDGEGRGTSRCPPAA